MMDTAACTLKDNFRFKDCIPVPLFKYMHIAFSSKGLGLLNFESCMSFFVLILAITVVAALYRTE